MFEFDLGFPGQRRDRETGLWYNYLRDCYDPATGRYCQFDPIGLHGGINGYSYVSSHPIGAFDPDGLTEVLIRVTRGPETERSTPGILEVTAGDRSMTGVTLELPDRQNRREESRIPAGAYDAFVRRSLRNGRVVELRNVPGGRTNIQFHAGNEPEDTIGCIVPGLTSRRDYVGRSREAMTQMLNIIDRTRIDDALKGERTTIRVMVQ